MVGSLDHSFTSRHDEVVQGRSRKCIVLGFADDIAQVGFDELLAGFGRPLAHALPKRAFLLRHERMRMADLLQESVHAVCAAVSKDDVFSVLIHFDKAFLVI